MQRIMILFLVLFSFTLHAQYEKGNWYLSGNSVIDSDAQTTVADSDFLPASASRTGYFLFDRLLVGGNVLNPAAFVRYYQPLKPQSKLSAFAELNVAADFSGSGNRITYQPAIGLEYQFSQDILLSATLQHSFSDRLFNGTSLQFGINTVIGRGGLAPGQNLLRKGALFIDPNIGQVGFSNIDLSNRNIESLGFSLHIGGGLMLTDRLSVDGSISANNSRSDYYDTSISTSLLKLTEVEADLGLRYFFTAKGKFRPYAAAGVGGSYQFLKVAYETPGQSDYSLDIFEVNPYVKLGTLFFLSEKVALDAGLEYNFQETSNGSAITDQMGLGVGVKIFLGREKRQ